MELTAQHHHEHPADPHGGHGKSATPGSHDRHAGHSVAMFRDKFWLSLALTIPVVVWSADVQHWIGYTAPVFPGSRFIPPILGTIVFFYGGIVFIRGTWGELASRKPGMMTLISLAILIAFSTSLAATFAVFEVDVWWELATLITIMVLGHWLEMKAIAQAHGALDLLAALLPDTAERVSGSSTEKVPISQLRVEDVLLVRPGERIPADGIIEEGTADVDESMITGESKPVSKSPGATAIAGTVVSGSSLRVRVTAVGEKTALSGIMRLVATAQASGSRTQALADRAAAILFYVALGAGALTFAYWWRQASLLRLAMHSVMWGGITLLAPPISTWMRLYRSPSGLRSASIWICAWRHSAPQIRRSSILTIPTVPRRAAPRRVLRWAAPVLATSLARAVAAFCSSA
jgi:Cu2+-exporting ATPase